MDEELVYYCSEVNFVTMIDDKWMINGTLLRKKEVRIIIQLQK